MTFLIVNNIINSLLFRREYYLQFFNHMLYFQRSKAPASLSKGEIHTNFSFAIYIIHPKYSFQANLHSLKWFHLDLHHSRHSYPNSSKRFKTVSFSTKKSLQIFETSSGFGRLSYCDI